MTRWLEAGVPTDLGEGLRELIRRPGCVAVPGASDGLTARLASRAGHQALYLSGAALSASMALPDLGMLTLEDVTRRAREVVRASGLPLIVDCDTGFGEVLNVMRTVRELEEAGVACIQLEDQQLPKKCGHLNDKALVSPDEMCAKIAAAVRARTKLLVCARTDAGAISTDEAIARANRYADAGADLIFVEALTSIEQMRDVRRRIDAPLLANMTEFGRTPQTTRAQFEELGFDLVIFPVSALRAAARAAQTVIEQIRRDGEVGACIDMMMTRAELYEVIDYFEYEAIDSRIARSVLPDAS